jgi:hypothetical protein
MAGIPWTDQEETVLKKLAKKGLSDMDIAQVLIKRTVHAINQKRTTLGLQQYNFPPKTEINMEAFNRFMNGEK